MCVCVCVVACTGWSRNTVYPNYNVYILNMGHLNGLFASPLVFENIFFPNLSRNRPPFCHYTVIRVYRSSKIEVFCRIAAEGKNSFKQRQIEFAESLSTINDHDEWTVIRNWFFFISDKKLMFRVNNSVWPNVTKVCFTHASKLKT